MPSVNRILLKTMRLTAWPLAALMALYLVTGYVLSGREGLDRWMSVETAHDLHRMFAVPLLVLFVAHTATAAYFAFVRWGWIRRKHAE